MSGDLTPGIASEIEEAIGLDATLKLMAACGGMEIKIPTEQRVASSQLAKIVGERNARAILERLGSGRVRLPMGPMRGMAGRRARAMRMMRDTDASNTEIARQFDLGLRTVEKYRAQMRDNRQMSLPLFDD